MALENIGKSKEIRVTVTMETNHVTLFITFKVALTRLTSVNQAFFKAILFYKSGLNICGLSYYDSAAVS